jgi:hypothetical protein
MKEKKIIYKAQAEEIIKNLQKRHMNGYYFEDCAQAVSSIIERIPDGSLVGLGGSLSVIESGLLDALRKKNIRLLDRYREGISKEEVWEMRKKGLLSDVFITGSNAVTLDGKLVNMDGIGNRVAAMIFGPEKVFLLVGMNKVVLTVDDAISRIKTVAAPLDSVKVDIVTPCHKKGFCQDPYCTPPHRICSQLVILEGSMEPGRVNVFLVGTELGY